MLQRIRLALQDRGSTDSFGGEVEADETFIGSLPHNMAQGQATKFSKGRTGTGKAIMMDLLDRYSIDKKFSQVRVTVVPDRTMKTLQEEIRVNVEPGSRVYNDD